MIDGQKIRLGDFLFDPGSGELVDVTLSNHDSSNLRLAPQPAQLLMLLIESHPAVVTRDSIRDRLWPGVTSDFDSNLHFCVRQIRAILGESASEPKYIETIPRRGYRLIADVAKDVDAPSMAGNPNADRVESPIEPIGLEGPVEESRAPRDLKRWVLGGLGVIVILFASIVVIPEFFGARADGEHEADVANTQKSRVRIAIMPFTSELVGFDVLGNGEIAANILESFSADFEILDVIGPSTTESYEKMGLSLPQLAQKIEPDLIVNGRFIDSDPEGRLLVEIIRANDGRHIWVKYFTEETSNREISKIVAKEVRDRVQLMKSDFVSSGSESPN